MRRKLFVTTLLLLSGIGMCTLRAQNLTIDMTNGTKESFELKTLKKITFSDNNMILNYTDGSYETIGIPSIDKLLLNGTTDLPETGTSKSNIKVYYDAAENSLKIVNAPEKETQISIYRLDGVLVTVAQISSNQNFVRTENLGNGLYLLKINNQVFKFMK